MQDDGELLRAACVTSCVTGRALKSLVRAPYRPVFSTARQRSRTTKTRRAFDQPLSQVVRFQTEEAERKGEVPGAAFPPFRGPETVVASSSCGQLPLEGGSRGLTAAPCAPQRLDREANDGSRCDR
jgi:hypothetical protein